jgi:hypothetical protein
MTMINWFMLFREIIAVYSENQTKSINAHCRQYAELLNVETGGTYSYQCDLKGLTGNLAGIRTVSLS